MGHHGDRAPGSLPRYEVADIFRAHGETYRATRPLSEDQRKVMRRIESCRTAVLGGHVDVCLDCGHEKPAYNSCRDRHCPKCQALDQARWLAKQLERILPIPYFHVVFTLPSELRTLTRKNRRLLYGLLFKAASQTLLQLGQDPERLQAQLGITAVLHTWTRDLSYHPHLHCIVTGGGLSLDGQGWVDSGGKYLFPVKVLGKLFRGKFLTFLDRLHQRGELDTGDMSPQDFAQLRDRLFKKNWVVYSKRPFAGPDQVFAYIGRYTHRVAISNHRILNITEDSVTIDTRDGKNATMPPLEFIRRFLQHVLPSGFVKIRHYGILAPGNVKSKLKTVRDLLLPRSGSESDEKKSDDVEDQHESDWRDLHEELTGVNLRTCPVCNSTRIQRIVLRPQRFSASIHAGRSPP